jgi:transcriptional regulator with XRE-family HTH domain
MPTEKTEKRKTKGVPNSIDVYVGQRLRVRRSLLGFTQEKLAEAIGLTFQQVQKYERGTNRISAGRLFEFAKILGVPVSYFYEQFGGATSTIAKGFSDNDQEDFIVDDKMEKKETMDLIKAYYALPDDASRKNFYRFLKSQGVKSED